MIIDLSYQKNCRDLGGMKTFDGKTIKIEVHPAEVLGDGIVRQSVFDEKERIFGLVFTQGIFG